jgi:hypothetical protein
VGERRGEGTGVAALGAENYWQEKCRGGSIRIRRCPSGIPAQELTLARPTGPSGEEWPFAMGSLPSLPLPHHPYATPSDADAAAAAGRLSSSTSHATLPAAGRVANAGSPFTRARTLSPGTGARSGEISYQ